MVTHVDLALADEPVDDVALSDRADENHVAGERLTGLQMSCVMAAADAKDMSLCRSRAARATPA
jgi:hypothetical protein